MKKIWKSGDLVVVFGGTLDKSKGFSGNASICKLIAEGDKDLLLHEFPEKSFSRSFTVSKKICMLLDFDFKSIVSSATLEPKIGDLVLSFSSRPGNDSREDMFTGILYSVSYKNGKRKNCKILKGENIVDAVYSDLMVLQSSKDLKIEQ